MSTIFTAFYATFSGIVDLVYIFEKKNGRAKITH